MTFLTNLPIKREEEIAELAEFIAEEYGAAGRVDPLSIAKRKKISFSFGHYEEAFDGMLECENKSFHIYCNIDRVGEYYEPRAKFTIAHELGHYFIDEHRNALLSNFASPHPSICEHESEMPIEREADCFASYLLMPRPYFKSKAHALPIGMKGILALKWYFNTSITSTALRYVGLNIRPFLFLLWRKNQIIRAHSSCPEIMDLFGDLIVQRKILPSSSATIQALSGARAREDKFFESEISADHWFESPKEHTLVDVLLYEQSISLGKYGAITLLIPNEETVSHLNEKFILQGKAV
ncbi:protein of unknown function DUF955 [Chloroherpeton thalassium ATCC 35110]|uniref:IrrE N-terminal-like domain-containing protein n=2 Tax=Chloroherpeton thalassium TaxID=100716 RepID=B3QVH4_CHLT3|nr:protein of unknown function DUF955 [Chloroherpeton thalassium ATCC 35110]